MTKRFSDAEWKVMNALWQHHPATVRDVLEAVEADTGWAYSTVKTLLSRLAGKGALRSEKRGNASSFVPLVSREQARRSALRALVERAFGGAVAPLVHHLIDQDQALSARDRRELQRLLDNEPPSAGEPADD